VEAKDYEGAYAAGRQALVLDAASGEPNYHLACYLSRGGKADEAFEMLGVALTKDPKLAKNAEGDPDFEPLRADPRWARTMAKAGS
jgi:hypothetical protein